VQSLAHLLLGLVLGMTLLMGGPSSLALAQGGDEAALQRALKAGESVRQPPPVTVILGAQKNARIEAELVPMTQWATPGSTAIIAVRQNIASGWHTYWRNPGDSGGPTTLDWTLPSGVSAGDILWPLPERQRLQGLMNYGYSGTVYLPVPIQIPADAQPGQTLRLTSQTLFMVCSDQMCVPDEFVLSLDLKIGEGSAPLDTRHGAAIQTQVASAPRPADILARAQITDGQLILTASGGPLSGTASKWAYFYPYEGGLIDHAAAQSGQANTKGLSLTLPMGRATKTNGLKLPLSGVLSTDLGAWEITASEGPALSGLTGSNPIGDGEGAKTSTSNKTTGFLKAALFALLGGLILNLMPCVFPILAMKAASLSRTAHDAGEARRDGLAFLGGVLVSFALLAGLLLALRAGGQALGWGFQLQSPAVIAGLSLLMLAVALNLSGVFHIGSALQNAGATPLSRLSGPAGAFFTGILAVIVAAPCTAPFMALALGAALVMPWPLALTIFLMLGLGLALPYVLISFSPRLLSRLPRPGAWMEGFRNLLAFPMYGTALWLAWVYSRQMGEALGLLFIAALLLALGLWLYGRAQSGRRLATVFAALALISALGTTVLAARAPVINDPSTDTPHSAIPSQPWSEAAVQAALSEGRPVLVNFTADWCVTCKINERAALSSPRTASAIDETKTSYFVGDWTRRDDTITTALQAHGRSGVPLYLVYSPDQHEPVILPQILTEGVVIKALKSAAS
jgi:thiol:disulfide interchange protein